MSTKNKVCLVVGLVGMLLAFGGMAASLFKPSFAPGVILFIPVVGFFFWWMAAENIDEPSRIDEERGKDRPIPD